jgi:predicted amidohydrolase YtcJ
VNKGLFLSTILTLCATVCAAEDDSSAPDLILHNGKIVTVDDQFSIQEAIAIKDGKILTVGTDAEVTALAGGTTEQTDLGGKMVLPGFVDGHPHMVHRGISLLTALDLNGVNSIEEIKERIAERVKSLEPGEWVQTTWIRGQPFAALPGALAEGRFPTRWDLDEVAPDNPVYIPSTFSYPLPSIFNSYALNELGIADDVPDDFGGATVVKDMERGIPNGQVHKIVIFNYNCSVCRKLDSLLPESDFETTIAGVKEQIHRNNAVGITTVYEGHHMLNAQSKIVQTLLERDELNMRIHIAYQVTGQQWMPLPAIDAWFGELSGKDPVGGYEVAKPSGGWSGQSSDNGESASGGWSGQSSTVTQGTDRAAGSQSSGWSGNSAPKPKMLMIEDDTDMVVMGGVTMGMGGGPVNMGMALMYDPYYDAFGNRVVKTQPNDLQKAKDLALLAARHGLRVNFGTGDEMGPDLILDVYDYVNQHVPITDKRFVIMHMPYATQANVAKAKELGVAITTSNNFEYDEYWNGMEDFERAFGDRAEHYSSIFVPWKWWVDADVPAALGSDNKEPIPLFTIWHAMTRLGRSGASNMTPSKKISREDAIRIQTINGAKLLNWEHKIGSLEAGKLADMVVIDTDILKSEIDEIKDSQVLTTYLGGKIVFQAD